MSYTNLTSAEKSVLSCVMLGYNINKMAAELNITEKGIKFHLTNIYRKYNVKSRYELMHLVNKLSETNNNTSTNNIKDKWPAIIAKLRINPESPLAKNLFNALVTEL